MAFERGGWPKQVPVTDLDEIVAVWEGHIEGDYYDSDHETWADLASLEAWRAQRP